jgi:hypothetical protein
MDNKKTNYFTEWFNAVPTRWRGMLTESIALVGGTVGLIIWLNSKGLAWYWIALYALCVVVFFLLSFFTYRKVAIERDKFKSGQLKDSKFYLTRTLLVNEHGTLEDLLKKSGSNTIWASMNVGRYLRTCNYLTKPWRKPPIDKLILVNPDCKIYAEKIEGRPHESVKKEIELTSGEAKAAGVDVYYFDSAIGDGLVIAFQTVITEKDIQGDDLSSDAWGRINQKEAWAKVDTAIPFADPENCPNYIIYNVGEEGSKAFKVLVRHYIKMLARCIKA